MSYSDILNLVKKAQGFHRPNLFKVEFTSPSAFSFDAERLSMNAVTAPIPGYAFSSHDYSKSGGVNIKHVNELTFNSATVSFLVSKDFAEHHVFENWRDAIADSETNRLGYYDEYVADMFVIPTDRNGNELARFQFFEVRPETVGDIDLSYDEENGLSKLTVAFAYSKYKLL